MRFTQDDKYEIIRLVEDSELGVNRTLGELDISKRTFCNWYGKYTKHSYDGLSPKRRITNSQWNRIPDQVRNEVVELALEVPEHSSLQESLLTA
jgi:putative transposase